MTVSVLDYSFGALAKERAAAEARSEAAKEASKAPNPRSLAKKRWWAEKKAREAEAAKAI